MKWCIEYISRYENGKMAKHRLIKIGEEKKIKKKSLEKKTTSKNPTEIDKKERDKRNRNARYFEDSQVKIREARAKEYYRVHKEELKEKAKEYRKKNREKLNRKQREYLRNRESYYKEYAKDYSKWYYETNREKMNEGFVISAAKRRAQMEKSGGDGVTLKQWRQTKEEYNNLCAYCNQKKPLSMDHIVPVSKGGIHDVSNIVPACRSCNSKKGNKSLLIFLYGLYNENEYYIEGNNITWIKMN
jgi:5-methylcytosine-specific restriction endonuclease McrA